MGIRIYVEAPRALWTRPENKTERVSYECMTFASARNILQAIYWKPAIEWVVESIEVLRPAKFVSIKRNEVNVLAIKGKDDFYIEDLRTQRYSLMLTGVANGAEPPKLAYIIEAHFIMTPVAGKPKDKKRSYTEEELANDRNPDKHLAIIMDRLQHGRAFMQPYLGTRENSAYFRLATSEDRCLLPEQERNKALGWMLYDMDFSNSQKPKPIFFDAKLKNGKLIAPTKEELVYDPN